MEAGQANVVPHVVPWLPCPLLVAHPAHAVLQGAVVLAGVEKVLHQPLLMVADNDRRRRGVDLAGKRVSAGQF